MIKTFSERGIGMLSDMILNIDDKKITIPTLDNKYNKQYNLRFIFEFEDREVINKNVLFGKNIADFNLENCFIKKKSLNLSCNKNTINLDLNSKNIQEGEYFLNCYVYIDTPVNNYPVLDTLPIPTEILTFYFTFSKASKISIKNINIQKYFDGFSHLGFFLADLKKMNTIIESKYEKTTIDLVEEFSNSTLIDDLFNAGVIMVVWGINPYTYPIYSTDINNIKTIESILGEKSIKSGTYRIDENIKKMSIVPGHELRNWSNLLKKEWLEIEVFGTGKKATITPYSLKDNNKQVTISSFLITRENEEIEESQPLLNIDLLYS